MYYICRTSSLPSFKLTLLSISSNDMTELDICSLEVSEEVSLLLLFAISSIISVFSTILCSTLYSIYVPFAGVAGMNTCSYLYSSTIDIKS